MTTAALYGADHEELDRVGEAVVDERTGIALSRGRFPKGYGHVDPNEDAVLALVAPAGTLLVVADGHNGVEASHAAVSAIAEAAEAALADGDPIVGVETCVAAAIEGVGVTLAAAPEDRRRSRTALSVALVADGRLYTATAGDTTVAIVRGRKAKIVSGTGPFLGPRSSLPEVTRTKLKAGDIVVAVTDGVSDYLGSRWTTALAEVTTGADSAPTSARAIVDLAMTGGAGDNVAAAVTDT
jgi:serine/threonine protein phosphatase PrpC